MFYCDSSIGSTTGCTITEKAPSKGFHLVALHSEGIWGLMIAWVTVGHLGVTVGHFRATAGHLRVIKGPLRVRN